MKIIEDKQSLKLENIYEHPAHLLRRSHQIFVSSFEKELGHLVFSPKAVIIMAVLYEHPGIDLATLAYGAAIDKSSCGKTVTAMEKKNILKVCKNAKDRRQKTVWLTDQGRELYVSCAEPMRRIEDVLLADMTPDERDRFLTTLKEFVTRNNDRSRAPFRPVVKDGGSA